MPKKSRNRKGNQYLKKATGLKAAQMIKQGNVRGAARMIGHYVDPENPVSAGKKLLSKKVLKKAELIYKDQMANKKSLGRAASKQIGIARVNARTVRILDSFADLTDSFPTAVKVKKRASSNMARSLRNANTFIEGGKVARTAARGAGVFGIAAMVASHLAGEMRKKKG
jgi:hypothetical protein